MQEADNINIHSLVPQSHSLSNTFSDYDVHYIYLIKLYICVLSRTKKQATFKSVLQSLFRAREKIAWSLKCRFISFCHSPLGFETLRQDSDHSTPCFSSCQVSLLNGSTELRNDNSDLTLLQLNIYFPPHNLLYRFLLFQSASDN